MTRLFLCEKPAQARDIAAVLGARSRGDGCLRGRDLIVTWCVGHLLEMDPPEAYGEEFKRWRLETLPILPERWKLHPRKGAGKQLKIVGQLLKEASEVVVATDADREGETIAREVLDRFGWNGPVLRLWLSALDPASIRKALAALLPGEKTRPLYLAGLARARADWMVGMNLTRAYTVAGRGRGHDGVLSVGRVQTPTLRLVVDRDREIEAFEPKPYWEVVCTMRPEQAARDFAARWVPPERVADAEGRCTSESAARTVAQKVAGKNGTVVKAEYRRMREAPPLPFDLGTLQQEASRRWGMGAKEVLDIAQALYETHKATTYPRTDCPYLPESMLGEAGQVLDALAASDPGIAALVGRADRRIRSRAWNDKKITAHHAIIPTAAPCNLSAMSEDERRIYDLVRRRYLAQFYPHHEYDQATLLLYVEGERFKASGRQVTVEGWRAALGQDAGEGDGDQVLPRLEEGSACHAVSAEVKDKQTKPPPRYTEGTLIAAMKNAARLVEDPELKKRLRETAGLGTEATRAGIIQALLDRGFLRREKRHLVSTGTGRALIDALPDPVKDPGTTALWEQALDDIAQGRGSMEEFLKRQAQWVRGLVQQVREGASLPEGLSQDAPPCPRCGRPMRRRKGRNGPFWGCTGYPECRKTLPDQPVQAGRTGPGRGRRGGGGLRQGRPPAAGRRGPGGEEAGGRRRRAPGKRAAGDRCPECGTGRLVQRAVRNGRNAGRPFLGCTRYPQCRYFAWG